MLNPEQELEVYLVGGAVRDRIMMVDALASSPQKDRDWVVVGSSPEQMVALGFRPVGKDFPVFLHPKTHEQYALARTERKTAPGYHGFVFSCDPDVTLEQDLMRRDLTINAMAMDASGNLIDPFGGERDIKDARLKHVSDAFTEDPVRILRVAKFAARFHPFGFTVDPGTNDLMSKMVETGEASALVAERVWQEMADALSSAGFYRFLEVLRQCNALNVVLPEVAALFGIPQVAKYHPEIDTGIHTVMSVQAVGNISPDPMVMFAVLVHDLGKALTPESELPSHRQHENRGLKPINALCQRLAVPVAYREFALRVCEFHLFGHRAKELKPATVLKLFEKLDGFRNPNRVSMFTDCCLADRRGRTGHENDEDDTGKLLQDLHRAALSVDTAQVIKTMVANKPDSKPRGQAIGQAIREARISAIGELKNQFDQH